MAPIWSADSKSLLFHGSREPASRTDWWAAPLDGGSPRATGAYARIRASGLSTSPESVFLPEAWASDGQVLFSARFGDSTNLWQMYVPDLGPADSPPQRVTRGTGLEIHPSATPGGTLVFSAVTQNIDLWSLPTDTFKGVVTGPMQRLTQDPATTRTRRFPPTEGRSLFSPTGAGDRIVTTLIESTGNIRMAAPPGC